MAQRKGYIVDGVSANHSFAAEREIPQVRSSTLAALLFSIASRFTPAPDPRAWSAPGPARRSFGLVRTMVLAVERYDLNGQTFGRNAQPHPDPRYHHSRAITSRGYRREEGRRSPVACGPYRLRSRVDRTPSHHGGPCGAGCGRHVSSGSSRPRLRSRYRNVPRFGVLRAKQRNVGHRDGMGSALGLPGQSDDVAPGLTGRNDPGVWFADARRIRGIVRPAGLRLVGDLSPGETDGGSRASRRGSPGACFGAVARRGTPITPRTGC
jgi:hypothetical protein